MRRGKPLEILDTKIVEKLVEETEKERDVEAEAKKKAAGKSWCRHQDPAALY